MVTSTGIESSKILKAAGVELLAYFCESLIQVKLLATQQNTLGNIRT
jgi:hypothetical protein